MTNHIYVSSQFLDQIEVSNVRAKYSKSGYDILRYYVELRHKALNLHREVSAPELSILANKVDTLVASWDQRYSKHLEALGKQANQQQAEQMTNDEERRRRQLRAILTHTLEVDDAVDWAVLKDQKPFPSFNPEPVKAFIVPEPKKPFEPGSPVPPTITFIDRLTGSAKRKQAEYDDEVRRVQLKSQVRVSEYNKKLDAWTAEKQRHYESEGARVKTAEEEHRRAEQAYYAKQKAMSQKVDQLQSKWAGGDSSAIEEHASMVLENSDYGDLIDKRFEVAFDAGERTLVIEYSLPTPGDMPVAKTVRYVQRSGEYSRTLLSQKDQKDLYDSVCYQICLRTVHEVFEADTHGHIERIAFNGSVEYVDTATGKQVRSTLLSMVVDRKEFLELNLALVEPKACFKALKGVSAASLKGLTPVAPIIEMDKSDRRFIEAQNVLPDDEISTNLAAMHWEEFEHLVRDLFEREFAERGGSVHVTQSSSDGGVDAVAFDPDPISGGKIIIQAKRYTNTVGLSAVRDLYGTTMNEGANKGILVTTADFGPDAHKFASDKPITLMSGNNLLHLLEKHGIKAKINITEARRELGLRDRGT